MSDAEAIIRMIGKDEASGPIETASSRINKAWKSMRDEQRTVQREYELNNRTLVATGRAISSIGNVVHRVTSLYNTWNMIQLRVQHANENVRDSSRDLQDTLNEFGPDSKQYQDALERNAKALEEQKNAQRDLAIGYGLMVTDIATSSGRIITDVIPKLRKFNSVLGSTNRLSGKAGMLAKGAGVAGGAGLLGFGIMGSQAMSEEQLTDEQKLMSIGESTAGGAILGATVGSIVPGIGTAIGAGAGAAIGFGTGVATNYGKQITQIFQINATTPQDMINQMGKAARNALTYGQ